MYRWLLALVLMVGLGYTVAGCGGKKPEKGGPTTMTKPATTAPAPGAAPEAPAPKKGGS